MYFSFLASSLTWPETRYRAGRSGRCSAGARILVLRVSNGRPSARYRGSFSGFMRRPACATSRRVQCVVLTFAVTRWAARWRGRAARWRIHGGMLTFSRWMLRSSASTSAPRRFPTAAAPSGPQLKNLPPRLLSYLRASGFGSGHPFAVSRGRRETFF